MKSILFTVAVSLHALLAFSQDDVFSNKTNEALEKVIRDFPNHFHNIKGDQVAQRAQTIEYKSIVQVPGASSCVITKYTVAKDEMYSWNCTAINARDFSMARNKFREIYDQIENTIIKMDGQKPFIVSGQYRTPYENRKFSPIVFELLPAVGDMKKLKIGLGMEKDPSGIWKVIINVYDEDHKAENATASVD